MKISVKMDGLDAVKASLRGLSDKKIKVAAVAALNDAAYLGSKKTQEEMQRVFDRPTRWVIGGVRYNKARKDKLESSIDFDKWGNKTNVTVEHVLKAEISGGNRKHKRHEVALQRAGILPPGMYIVPGDAANVDAYGNMSSAQIVQIMSWFKAFGEQGYKANMTQKSKDRLSKKNRRDQRGGMAYVVFYKHKSLLPGIYQRIDTGFASAIRPVMIFVRSPVYKKRFDFYGVAEKAARAEFDRAFPMYLDKLLKERGL